MNNDHDIQAILFDLGGVLLDKSRWKAFWYLPKWSLLCYMLRTGNGARGLQRDFFRLLDTLDTPTTHLDGGHSYEGMTLPAIMDCWMMDAAPPCRSIIDRIRGLDIDDPRCCCCPFLSGMDPSSGLVSSRGRYLNRHKHRLICKLAEITFDPDRLASVLQPVTEGVNALQAIRKHRPDIRIYLLSNFNYEAYQVVRGRFPMVFDYVDDVLISGEVKCLKPDPKLFQMAMDRWQLTPHQCLFIDDAPENVQGALRSGMQALHFQRKTFC